MEEFRVAAVFSDHCVFQREKPVDVFGVSEPGTEISALIFDAAGNLLRSACGICGSDGKWLLRFAPLPAQNGCSMSVKCSKGDNIIEEKFTDIAVGEVWLAGGQSNMEFELQNCTEGPAELALTDDPDVRFYYTNKIAWMDSHFFEAERNTCWQTWNSEWKKSWSAVGYFFAKKLAADLGVTVGVIGCNWGGTSASAWMSRGTLERDSGLRIYLDEYAEATAGKSVEQQCAEFDEYEAENAVWQEKCNELYRTRPGIEWNEVQEILGPCKWPGPKSCKNPYRPCGLFDCMVKRVAPYTLRGVLWYQGESDDHRPSLYERLFSAMILEWRSLWHDVNLPFVFVQLPEHRYTHDRDFKNWPLIREAQAKVLSDVNNTGMVCAADLGQFNDIHPRAKRELGFRMERNALCTVYGILAAEQAFSPMYRTSYPDGKKFVVEFANAPEGFVLKDDSRTLDEYRKLEKIQGNEVPAGFTGFELCGADGIFYPAEFEFGRDIWNLSTITLSCKEVSSPVAARYAWYNYGPVTVFGRNGLPLAPFRTSADSAEDSEHAGIQQIMTV